LLSRVLSTISEHQLIARGDRVLVAVSGGPDSVALLHALVRLQARLGVTLEVATVDHGLRPAAAAEATEVARRCTDLGLCAHVVRVDVAAERRPHVSLLDAARRARLAGLGALAERRGCARIALGHTADDQAETIFFRVVRGTGVDGLKGIPYRRGTLIRPLLDVRRTEILAFLRRLKLDFVSDPTNADPRFTRSRIRHHWLPALSRENPRVAEALLALAASARQRLAVPALAPDAPAALAAGAPPLGRRAAQVVRRLVAAGAGSHEVAVAGGVVDVTYGRAEFRARPAGRSHVAGVAKAIASGSIAPVDVVGPGRHPWPAGPARTTGAPDEIATREVEILLCEGAAKPAPEVATFDAQIFSLGLVLRSRRPGDRMRPRGGRGTRKLQDLLVDAKVPRSERETLPLLATRTGVVLFVPGLRPAEDCRPDPEARRWVEIRVR
jgi:tRNA(Ile)-lysidine synthase